MSSHNLHNLHNSSAGMLALIGSVFLGAALATAPHSATAAVFNVTESFWGSPASPNSLGWAIDQANTQPGPDTISISAGLVINVFGADFAAFTASGNATWLTKITESVTIEGNGAKLVGTPIYVTSGGLQATKTNIVGNVYEPAIRDSSLTPQEDIIVRNAQSFAFIGTAGADNSSIEVTISDLSADGLASFSNVYEGAKLTVSGGSFVNMVNYSQKKATGRGLFEAYAGSTLNLSDISITRSYPFADALDVNAEAALFFGTIQGSDATLNMENSSIRDSYGAGAVAWSGGTVNIVSSVIQNAGGVQIVQGALNFVNSILYMTGGDSLSQTNRIQALSSSVANITASSIFYDPLYTSVLCTNVSYQCNGMPLTAGGGSVLNVNSSVALPINTSIGFPGKDSYSEYSSGDLRADQFSFIGATDAQDANAVKTLFDNTAILTTGDTVPLLGSATVQVFDKLPAGAAPSAGGVLVGVIPDAGSGGANELINPIDGQPILVDVYGDPRTDPAGFRDIGAVNLRQNSYAVGGLLSGLVAGKSLVLTNNGGDDLSLTADGQFVFATPLTSGSAYSVAIKTQPSGETCAVTNGSGTVQTSDINQISVVCSVNQYQVGGNVTGLATGAQVELLLNGSLHTVATTDGSFQFPPVANGSNYDVTIGTQPSGQTCSVANGTGTVAGADVSNVSVTCSDTSVSQVMPGLPSGGGGAVVIDISGCTNLVSAQVIAAPQSPSQPPGFAFPYGLVEFEANGCNTQAGGIQVTFRYPIDLPAGAAFFKEEGTANTYFPFNAVISGRTVIYTLTDNGPGDDSSVVGTIFDPAGVAVPVTLPPAPPGPPRPVPVLPIYGLWLLVMGVVMVAYRALNVSSRAQGPNRLRG